MSNDVLRLHNIYHAFKEGTHTLNILKGCELTLGQGESVALIGPSGAGKSTLLQIAGLLETPKAGSISIDGHLIRNVSDKTRTNLRRLAIGFVYQFHHLLPEFSARENIMLPQMIAGKSKKEAQTRADELLDKIALLPRASHRPAELSGGEQQRIAIARALANHPKILIADEPTGNLDPETATQVFDLLRAIVKEEGLALLMATHNHALAKEMDKTLLLKDGTLIKA